MAFERECAWRLSTHEIRSAHHKLQVEKAPHSTLKYFFLHLLTAIVESRITFCSFQVNYEADHQLGYVANVQYEGEAQYPQNYGPAVTFRPSQQNSYQPPAPAPYHWSHHIPSHVDVQCWRFSNKLLLISILVFYSTVSRYHKMQKRVEVVNVITFIAYYRLICFCNMWRCK